MAGRLGTASLAAHQVVAQLWLLTAYVVDGFAVAGTVIGSRLAAREDAASLRHAMHDPRYSIPLHCLYKTGVMFHFTVFSSMCYA